MSVFTSRVSVPRLRSNFVGRCSVRKGVHVLQAFCPGARRVTFVSSGACNNIAVRTLMQGRVRGFPSLSLVLVSKHGRAVCAVIRRLERLPRGAIVVIKA